MTDLLATVTDRIRSLTERKFSPLNATFMVCDSLSEEDAKELLRQLICRQFLSVDEADIAQFLAQRLGVPIEWSHARLQVGELEWKEGRGE